MSAWLVRRGGVGKGARAQGWTSEEMLAIVFFHNNLSAETQLFKVTDISILLKSR